MSEHRSERLERYLLARVSEYGYTHIRLLDPMGADGPITYTVGLPAHIGHPELVMCGVSSDTAVTVIGAVADLLRMTPALDGRVHGALSGDVPVWVANVPSGTVEERLLSASWWREQRHDGQPATAKQIIIPDRRSLFPWEPGCQPGYGRLQGILLPEIAVRPPTAASPGDERASRD